jgi:hypothetical protein
MLNYGRIKPAESFTVNLKNNAMCQSEVTCFAVRLRVVPPENSVLFMTDFN